MSNKSRLKKRKKVEPLPVVIDPIDIDISNSVINLEGEVGRTVAASTFLASGGDGTLTWSATGLPNPATINSSTSVIAAFIPTLAGAYPTVIRAADASGRFDTVSFNFTIAAALSVELTPTIAGVGLGYNLLPIITGGRGHTIAITSGAIPTGFSFDATTGAITEDVITAPEGDYTFNYRVTSTDGTVVDLSRTITVSTARDATLDFTAAGNALRQTVIPGTNWVPATLDATGFWVSIFLNCANVPDTNKVVFSSSDKDAADVYFGIGENTGGALSITFRKAGGGSLSVNSGAVTAGHHLATARFFLQSVNDTYADLFVDALTHSPVLVLNNSIASFAAHDTITLGGITRTLSGALQLLNEFDHQAYGLAWGTGDPTLAHAWAWNGGTPREIDTYNFAGDASCDLLGYWRMVFPAAAGLDTATDAAALVDSVGGLDTWVETGSMAWAAPKAAFLGQNFTPPASPALTIPLAAPNTIVFTSTLPAGAWNNIQYDITKIGIWASTNGYGPINITSMTSSIAGLVATITFHLDRTIYLGEEVTFEMLLGWIFDTNNNKPAAQSGTATNNSTTAVPATTTKASWGKISWEISAARPIRFSLEGCPHWNVSVAAGGGVNIIAITPACVVINDTINNAPTRTINGSMLNAFRGGRKQGFDSFVAAAWGSGSLNKVPPIAVDMHDCVISAVSSREFIGHLTRSCIEEHRFVHFTDGLIGTTEIARPSMGYNGSAARPALTLDANTIAAALPSYSTAGVTNRNGKSQVPDIAEVAWRMGRPNIAMGMESAVLERSDLTAHHLTYTDGGYGLDVCVTLSAAVMMLISDQSVTEKRKLVLWIAHHGHQWYHAIKLRPAGVSQLTPNGGHNQGQLPIFVCYLYWTGQKALIVTLLTVIGPFNEGGQDYVYTADHLAKMLPHDRPDGPAASNYSLFAKRKVVTDVTGLQITCAGMGINETQEVYYRNMFLIRESDGVKARIIDHTSRGNDRSFGIDAQPTPPFAVGNIVYGGTGYPISLGDANWLEGQTLPNYGNPSPELNYRTLQDRSGTVMALRALGLMHANFIATEKYCERAVLPANPETPPGGWPYPWQYDFYTTHRDYVDATFSFASIPSQAPAHLNYNEQMWGLHWNTIKDVVTDPTI